MAYRNSNTRSSSSTNTGANKEAWKVTGYLNFSLLSKTGGKSSLGAIPLNDAVAAEKALIARLVSGGDEAVQALLGKLKITYKPKSQKVEYAVSKYEDDFVEETSDTQGYLNFLLPTTDGQERQLGYIPLKDKEGHKNLRWTIEDGGEEALAEVHKSLSLNYRSSVKGAGKSLFAF
jgi:hypothetical protein